MNTDLIIIISAIVVFLIILAIIVITIIMKRKKNFDFQKMINDPKQQEIENSKRAKIKKAINEGMHAMMYENFAAAIHHYNIAKTAYDSLLVKDEHISKGLRELHQKIPRRYSLK